MNTTAGFGRTGNYVAAMFRAARLAYACRMALELPEVDERGDNVFDLDAQKRFIDFTSASGPAWNSPMCQTHAEGNPRRFYHLPETPDSSFVSNSDIALCLKHYLGACDALFCKGEEHGDALVIHLRQGDVYRQVPPPPRRYGQPSASYYLSIIAFVQPQQILFVSEAKNPGPIMTLFQLLKTFNYTVPEIKFQSTSFREDLRTLMCARRLVESRSSLMHLVRWGSAEETFSTECFQPIFSGRKAFAVSVDVAFGKKYFNNHTNTAEEWVDMLLSGSSSPIECLQDPTLS